MIIEKYGEKLKIVSPKKHKIYEGQTFGKWIIIDKNVYQKTTIPNRVWAVVKCTCGLEKLIYLEHLISNRSKGCKQCRTVPNGKNNKLWRGVGQVSASVFYRLKREASIRGIEFTVDISYIANILELQNNRCALSNRPISFGIKNRKDYYLNTTASLDRIDSSKGYVVGNVQWLHKDINLAKRDLSDEQFIKLCEDVVKWQNSLNKK